MAGRTCSKELMKVLTTPSKVANALDWRKSTGGAIATMNVHADRIGITISRHPDYSIISNNESSSSSLSLSLSSSSSSSSSYSYSLPMRQKGLRKIPDSSRQQLAEILKEHKVCGFVVSWPIQKDTGLMGASCGRTLFAIEELLQSQQETIPEQHQQQQEQHQQQQQQQRPMFTPSRPICLWDTADAADPAADAFGRSSVYARTSNKTEHRASEEQYHQDESIVAVQVWEDFVQTNWPEIYQQQQQQQQQLKQQQEQEQEQEQEKEQEQEQSEKFDHEDDREWDDDESASSSEQWQTMMVA